MISNEYPDILNRFILIMSDIHEDNNNSASAFTAAMHPVCEALHIAQIRHSFFETMLDYKEEHGTTTILYNEGERDESSTLKIQEMMGIGNPVLFEVIPISGSVWDDKDKEFITSFIKLIHLHRARTKTMHLAEQYMYRDREMGIYNLPFFLRTVGRLISQRQIGRFSCCRFNMQSFASVNLQIGRPRATELLRRYVTMLQSKLSDEEYVCRIGGDNFICLYLDDHQDLVTEHMTGVQLIYDENSGESIQLSTYAGYYCISDMVTNSNEVMDYVSTAAAQAKSDKSRSQMFYDEVMIRRLSHKKKIETLFSSALADENLLVYYQPKINLDTNEMVGAEALCRWRQGDEIWMPDSFIPILEQTTAICRLDFYMLEHVCRDIRRWLDEEQPVVPISVNLSRRNLEKPHLLENIIQIVNMYGIPHEYIEIELTETSTINDFSELGRIVSGLREVGINTSVDDFGIGYSSISMLRELPWQVLKIDRSFLPDHKDSNRKHYTMLKSMILMAQELGIDCVVEGVETQEQVTLLKQDGCSIAQGFFFDQPLPVDIFEERLHIIKGSYDR